MVYAARTTVVLPFPSAPKDQLTDPTTGEVIDIPVSIPVTAQPPPTSTVYMLPRRTINPFLLSNPPPVNPTDGTYIDPSTATSNGYTLSDLAVGAGAPSVGAAASKDSLKTLDTSTTLTDLSGSTVQDNTYLYLGIGVAAIGGLYFYSQTDAGKKTFAKPR